MSSVALVWSGARSQISALTRSCSKRFTGAATRAGLRVSRHSLSSVEYLFGQWRADNRVRAPLSRRPPHTTWHAGPAFGNTHRVLRNRWVSRQSGCGPVQTTRLDDRQPDERWRRNPLPHLRRIAATRLHHVRSRRRDMPRRCNRVS